MTMTLEQAKEKMIELMDDVIETCKLSDSAPKPKPKGYIDPDKPPLAGTVFCSMAMEYYYVGFRCGSMQFWTWEHIGRGAGYGMWNIKTWNNIIAPTITSVHYPSKPGRATVKLKTAGEEVRIECGGTGTHVSPVDGDDYCLERLQSVLKAGVDFYGEPLINVEVEK